MLTKTGECYFRDDSDQLWVAESFVDDKGVVITKHTIATED